VAVTGTATASCLKRRL